MQDLFEKIYKYSLISNSGMIFVVSKAIFSDWRLALVSLPVGIVSLFGIFYFGLSSPQEGNFLRLIASFLLFFLVFLLPTMFYAKKAVDKEIILRVEKKFGRSLESKEKAIAYALAKIFDIPTDQFWSFAGDLQKARIHYFGLTNPISGINYFKLIYDPDSKSRIYTLLLALLAIIAARTFHHETPTTLTDIFEWFFTNFLTTFRYWVVFTISASILLFSVYVILIFIFIIIVREVGFRFFLTKYSRSEYAIKRLEKVLLELHNITIETTTDSYQSTLIYKANKKE